MIILWNGSVFVSEVQVFVSTAIRNCHAEDASPKKNVNAASHIDRHRIYIACSSDNFTNDIAQAATDDAS